MEDEIRLVFGVFTDRTNAEDAIEELKTEGFDVKDISVMVKDTREREAIVADTGSNVAGSAVLGTATGGVIGGLTGMLIGIGAIKIPGIGSVFIGGPIATALGITGTAATTVSGAVIGALSGGLVGALVGLLGIPEEEARIYEEHLRSGSILLALRAEARSEEDTVRDILDANGADDVRSFSIDLHRTKRIHARRDL